MVAFDSKNGDSKFVSVFGKKIRPENNYNNYITITCMHLADAFIQSDLQCNQAIHFLSVCVFPGNSQPFALLTHCSTTEPQEHHYSIKDIHILPGYSYS